MRVREARPEALFRLGHRTNAESELRFSVPAYTFGPLSSPLTSVLQNPTIVIRPITERVRDWLYPSPHDPTLGLVLSGGGARSAYQAGVLEYISEAFPETEFPILTGVSAGAINTAHLANHTKSFPAAAHHLVESWENLELDNVVAVESGLSLLWGLLWRNSFAEEDSAKEGSAEEGARSRIRRTHGLLDTTPLWAYLNEQIGAQEGRMTGIAQNLEDGRLRAVAVITTNYATGQTVTWVQGEDFEVWERPDRISRHTRLTIDHVMASTALPLVFPAVQIDQAWYGDGGIRLAAPLAPALHLGADRILAISNQHQRSRAEADAPAVTGYPPTAQIIGILMNAIFSDALDQDAFTIERVNALLRELPPSKRHGMRPVDLLQIRPSVDLGRLAFDYEDRLPASIRFLTTGLGTRETQSPDWLSVLLFDDAYISRLLSIGYHDAREQHDDIEDFLHGTIDRGPHPKPDPTRDPFTETVGPVLEPSAAESGAGTRAGSSGNGHVERGSSKSAPSPEEA